MLDECVVEVVQESVVRLAATAGKSVRDALDVLELPSEDFLELEELLSELGIVISAEEIVADSFEPREDIADDFSQGRFSDGTIGVFYAALDEATLREEIAFHILPRTSSSGEFSELRPRLYRLIRCSYLGLTADLRGKETEYPLLVSQTSAGYPFCQSLALQAKHNGIVGFLTASARHSGGTCVPVFSQQAISQPEIEASIRAFVSHNGVEFHRL